MAASGSPFSFSGKMPIYLALKLALPVVIMDPPSRMCRPCSVRPAISLWLSRL